MEPGLYRIDVWIAAFFAILFLQSGFDKVTDRAGNLAWMVPHFEKSPFRGLVPTLLSILTLMEVATGALCLVAAVWVALSGGDLLKWGMLASVITLLSLFTGQRLAKDYVGAASLAGYFAVAAIGAFAAWGP